MIRMSQDCFEWAKTNDMQVEIGVDPGSAEGTPEEGKRDRSAIGNVGKQERRLT